MSLELEDDLALSYAEDYVDEAGAIQRPSAASDLDAVRKNDPMPVEPPGRAEANEKAKHTKAYKLIAPVGALFGRLAKVGLGAASCFAYNNGVLCLCGANCISSLGTFGSVSSTPLQLQQMT
jgi:hypothetical protein